MRCPIPVQVKDTLHFLLSAKAELDAPTQVSWMPPLPRCPPSPQGAVALSPTPLLRLHCTRATPSCLPHSPPSYPMAPPPCPIAPCRMASRPCSWPPRAATWPWCRYRAPPTVQSPSDGQGRARGQGLSVCAAGALGSNKMCCVGTGQVVMLCGSCSQRLMQRWIRGTTMKVGGACLLWQELCAAGEEHALCVPREASGGGAGLLCVWNRAGAARLWVLRVLWICEAVSTARLWVLRVLRICEAVSAGCAGCAVTPCQPMYCVAVPATQSGGGSILLGVFKVLLGRLHGPHAPPCPC